MGFVYLAVNDALPGLVKIGKSDDNIQTQIEDLSQGFCTSTPFKCAFQYETNNHVRIERDLHNLFDYCRLCRNGNLREFFMVDWRAVVIVILILDGRKGLSQIPKRVTDVIRNTVTMTLSPNTLGDYVASLRQNEDNNHGETPPSSDIPIGNNIPIANRREQYVNFVQNNVQNPATAYNYANALDHLSGIIRKNVFEITETKEAEELKQRLLNHGDLHRINAGYNNRVMSAAMGKYVAFLRHNPNDNH